MDAWPIDELFDEDYLDFYAPSLTGTIADRDVALISSTLSLAAGASVLDLACGHGRIANRLAEYGANVTGLDATAAFLDLARADAAARGVTVEYVLGDMRELPWTGRFDAVVSWFTSYGYFDDAQNRQVLSEVHRCLAPGGQFLVELNHRDGLLAVWQPSSVVHRPDGMMIDERRFEPLTGRSHTVRTIVRAGTVRRVEFFTRLLGFTELRSWLLDAGFRSVDGLRHDGTPLTASDTRMIVVAAA